jgi:tetratricopeptide (TPR) repeat protein
MRHLFVALTLAATLEPGLWAAGAQSGSTARPSVPAGRAAPTADLAPAGGAYYEFLLGLHLETMGDVSGALAAYERAERLDSSSAEIPAALAELYVRQDRSTDAVAAAERAIKANPESPEANWIIGRIYAAMSETADPRDPANADFAARAVPYLERADVVAHPAVRFGLARLYMRVRDFAKAISVLVPYVAEQPDEPDAIELLAEAYQAAGRSDEAIALLEKSAPDAPDLYAVLGQIYLGQQRWDDAAKALGEAVKRRTRNVTLRVQWATALLNTGSLDDARRARTVLEEVTAASATNLQALYLLAQAQRRTSDLTAAAGTARKMMTASPTGLAGPFVLAQVFEEQGEYRQAVETLEPVLAKTKDGAGTPADIDPARLWAQLGTAHQQLREFPQAIDAFTQARRLSPQNPAMDLLLVQALLAAGRIQEATGAIDRARGQYPRDLGLARLQARTLRLGGRFDQAVAVMKTAVGADADNPLAYIGLAEVYADGDRPSEAMAVLQDASARFPRDLSIRFQLGAVFEHQKRYADAERVFRQVIADDPQHADALNYLGYMLAERGERLEESVQYVQRALELDPGNAAYLDSLGWAYYKLNRLDLADAPLREAGARMRSSSVVQSHLGDLLFKRGQYGDAIGAWQRALEGDGEAITRSEIQKKIDEARRRLGKK